jgi:peroxiredoxin
MPATDAGTDRRAQEVNMRTWRMTLLTIPARVWIALSIVLGLSIGLVAGAAWRVSGLIFGVLLGLVLGAGLIGTLRRKYFERSEAAYAGSLLRIASSFRAGETQSALEALENEINWRLTVSVWNRDITRLPAPILENWQSAKVYYDKYKPVGPEIPEETYNVLTYLEQVPWSEQEAARREFDATYQTGQPRLAPEISRADVRTWINTDPVTLQELRGQVVLIAFWGTRCKPCVAALPEIQKLFSTYSPRGFTVIGVTADEPPAVIQAFIESRNLTFPVCTICGNNLWRKYAIEGMPTYFLIDRNGLLVWGPSHGLPDDQRILGLL